MNVLVLQIHMIVYSRLYMIRIVYSWLGIKSSTLHTKSPHQFTEICGNNDGQINKDYSIVKVVSFHLRWEMGIHINTCISMSFYTVDSTSLKNLDKKIVVTLIRLSMNFHGFSFQYIKNFYAWLSFQIFFGYLTLWNHSTPKSLKFDVQGVIVKP